MGNGEVYSALSDLETCAGELGVKSTSALKLDMRNSARCYTDFLRKLSRGTGDSNSRATTGMVQMVNPNVDDQGPLPDGYEYRVIQSGRPYYVNHETKTTSWIRPSAETSDIKQSPDGQQGLEIETAKAPTFFSTECGFVGLGPPGLRTGDTIVILFGASRPFAAMAIATS